ncbi:MAG: asparagine synthase (glutamine-hydrolyzing) [Planctomycetes bacterium]|nr:asparagine synthase (glutamine-hydrolyzing) [Planctomycetota bacterium]
MCGICGIYSNEPVDKDVVKRMNDALAHRGPDDEGIYLNQQSPFVGLANRRLSIIDLSPAGHQPMSNENQTIWITYNGEIYNYIELRSELQKLGHRFRSDTDTEVIIHAYEEWGEDCLRHFNGMWAFAIWNSKRRRLFCARDHFGIKPFYYFWDGKTFVFASEIKSILTHPAVPRKPDETIIYDYLTTGLIDHSEETFFHQIKQLRPAHYLTINPDRCLEVNKWWDIAVNHRFNDNSLNGKDITDRFKNLLEDSVRLRLRSDVPVGTCLSGGLDSSSIVCLANNLIRDNKIIKPELIGRHQKTFSACYDDPRVDERRFIKEVLNQTGAESHLTFPNGQGLWTDLERLIWHQDEPFGSTSIYAQWSVMKLTANNGVKVLLDGQGGDELMAGYGSYQGTFIAQLINAFRITQAYREIKNSSFNKKWVLLHTIYKTCPSFIKSISRQFINKLLPSKSPFNRAVSVLRPVARSVPGPPAG